MKIKKGEKFKYELSPFAERGGFEPPVQVFPYVSLANWWFQPLTHLSGLIAFSGCKYKPKKR